MAISYCAHLTKKRPAANGLRGSSPLARRICIYVWSDPGLELTGFVHHQSNPVSANTSVFSYTQSGVDELDLSKLPTLLEIKYKSVTEGTNILGGAEKVREIFFDFQKMLYLPRSEYAS